jgi:hypothetical protein
VVVMLCTTVLFALTAATALLVSGLKHHSS